MKSKLLSLFFILGALHLNAQIVFSEDFDGVGGSTVGGAGTYTFPSGWTLVNVDNRTPDAAVAYVNAAWERREDFANNVADSCAFSTSWYSPVGAADDWMWTPAIGPLPVNSKLKWNAVTYDPTYPDGYEVRIMTTMPTGTTGNLGNMVSSSTQLFSIAAETTTWSAREVDLSAYSGMTVYIGFRNTSNNMFLLLIDDVVVEQVINYDIAIDAADTASQYTLIPLPQADDVCIPGATVRNNGLLDLTNVSLDVIIKDASGIVVYNETASGPATLTPSATAHITTSPFTPLATGSYTIHYHAWMTEGDQNMINDSLAIAGFVITDSVYARDNGTLAGGVGIGAGNGGYVGQDFHLPQPANVSSVTLYVTKGYTGRQLAAVLWSMSSGKPDSIVASTDTLLYIDDSARYYTINMASPTGNIMLPPGTYALTMIEFDSTIQLGQTLDIFTTGHTWVYWPTTPLGDWGHMEAFGGSFARASMIRLNVSDPCASFSASDNVVDATCQTCPDGSATITPSGGYAPYSYAWSNGDTTATVSGLLPGTYSVTVTDAQGCSLVLPIQIDYNVGIDEKELNVSIYPNPSHGTFTISAPEINGQVALIEITDISGKVVYRSSMTDDHLVVSDLSAGVYGLRLTHNNAVINRRIVIE